jgi:membrane fusion protein, multidrug efflux system
MAKRIIIVIIALAILFGLVFGFHAFRNVMIGKYIKNMLQAPVTISTTTAKLQNWNPTLHAVGNLTAVNGVDVNSQVPGQVVKVLFTSGQNVQKGDQLIQLDDSLDQQTLKTQQAQLKFAEEDYNRRKTLAQSKVIPQSDLDQSYKNFSQAQAAVASAELSVAFKKIKAPFSGRLGISQVNVGQFITSGQPLVTLQQMDPLFVDFSLPEQQIKQVSVSQPVEITVDAYPNRVFSGKITALNSKSDPQTHTIGVRATIPNPKTELYPGVFAGVNVLLPVQQAVVTVPQTAIAYSLHGNSVYVVIDKGKKDEKGKPLYEVEQRFVTVGTTKGDQIVILSGIKAGEQVVNSGQLKLQPGAPVNVDNSIQMKE